MSGCRPCRFFDKRTGGRGQDGKGQKKATTVIVVVPEKETAGSAGEPVADKRVNGPTNATASSNKKRASKRPLTAEEYQEAQAAAFRRYGNDFDTPFFK